MISTEWDYELLKLSSKCAEPACFASWIYYRLVTPLDPQKFDNCTTKIAEVAYRVILATSALIAITTLILPLGIITLGIMSKVLRAIGFSLQKSNYTHLKGNLPEKTLDTAVKVMTWNVCGIGGGLHYDHGGVIDWRSRLSGILEKIQKEEPDVLVLQEIYDTDLAENLMQHLKEDFAHFYFHLGANVMGSVGGLMVLSKCATHRFTNTSFKNNSWTLNRTFATLEIKASPQDETPCARIIGTHLIHDDNEARREQIGQIVSALEPNIPTLLMGDLNLERDDEAQAGMLAPYFEHGYQGTFPTRTNQMLKEWDKKLEDPGDFIDYISIFREGPGEIVDTHIIHAYDSEFNTRTALSDHNGLAAKLLFR